MFRFRILIISIAIIFLSACGPSKAIISLEDIQNLEVSSNKNIVVNIRNVSDSREVVLSGENPAIPQLATVEELSSAPTSTIAAQIRNLSGNVNADIFTEKKITTIVKSAIEESFRRAGYNVSNSEENSIPVNVNIINFWAYNTGFWVFKFHFDISVEILGDLPILHKQQTFSSNIQLTSALGAAPRSYKNTISKGMDKFIRELATQLN